MICFKQTAYQPSLPHLLLELSVTLPEPPEVFPDP